MNWTALINELGAEILKAIRAPEFIFPTLLLPVAFYSMFAIALPGSNQNPSYLLATYGVFAAIGPAIFGFGVSVATEREHGWLSLKRVAPVSSYAFISAKLLTTIIFTGFSLILIYAVAGFFAGVALPLSTWITLLCVHLLSVIPFSFIGLALGFSLNANASVAISNLIFLALSALGGLWIPIFLFPNALQTFAYFLPSFHLGEIALTVSGNGNVTDLSQHILISLLMTCVFMLLAYTAWFKQRF